MATKTDDPFLTIPELAARYRTSPKTVHHWRLTGYGPHGIKVGVRVLYRLSECERWEKAQENEQAAG